MLSGVCVCVIITPSVDITASMKQQSYSGSWAVCACAHSGHCSNTPHRPPPLFPSSRCEQLNGVSLIHRYHPRPDTEEGRVRRDLELFLANAAIDLSRNDETGRSVPRILLTHVPLQCTVGLKQQILASIAPDVVFSGHTHHVASQRHKLPVGTGTARPSSGGGGGNGSRESVEYTVPTCSYRMGEMNMGVGAATIGGLWTFQSL